jgi:O-antigen/teichoic acid export membrane protein
MLVKNSVIYLVSSILNKAVPFLLLPIMTTYLTPQEYGKLAIFMVFVAVYMSFIGMNMHANISKHFFNVQKDELAHYIGNILILLSITTIFYFCVSLGIYSIEETFFSMPSWLLLLVPFMAAMTMISTIYTTLLRNQQRAYIFGVFQVSNTVIKISATILFLVSFGLGWYSQVFGVLLGSAVFMLVSIIYIKRQGYMRLSFDRGKVKSILHISVPLIPHVLAGAVISMSDRLFIEQMVGLEAVGLYAVGYSFGMIVMLFTDAFIKAWSPWFYKNLAEPTESKKEKIVIYTYVYIVGMFILALSIALVAEFMLPYFVDAKFYPAREFILWVALGYAVRGVYQIFFPYLVHISRTSFLAVSTVLAAFVNLSLNYLLIKEYGAIGAAYATLAAFAVSALLVFWYQQRNYYMPWFVRRRNVS